MEDEPNLSFVRHVDWDMQVENPGAPPAPPAHAVPLQKAATGAQSAVSKAAEGGELVVSRALPMAQVVESLSHRCSNARSLGAVRCLGRSNGEMSTKKDVEAWWT